VYRVIAVRIAILALMLFALACAVGRTGFVLILLDDPTPESTVLGEPPLEGHRGGRIPVAYHDRHARRDVRVALGREPYVPSFRIESSAPIAVDAGSCSSVHRHSATAVTVDCNSWRPPSASCLAVGDRATLRIAFAGTSDAIVLSGRVRSGGTFWSIDGL